MPKIDKSVSPHQLPNPFYIPGTRHKLSNHFLSIYQNILHFTIVWLALTSFGCYPECVLQVFYFIFSMNLLQLYITNSFKKFRYLLHYFIPNFQPFSIYDCNLSFWLKLYGFIMSLGTV